MATQVPVEDRRNRLRSSAKVEQYMNKNPVCFLRDTPLEEAVKILIEKNISGAPVVEKYPDDETGYGRLIGVLSEEDLLWKEVDASDTELAEAYRAPYLWSLITSDDSALEEFEDQALKVLSRSVGLSMTEKIISAKPDTVIGEAAAIMLDAKVKRLPVLAPRENGKPGLTVVGVISRKDVLHHVLKILEVAQREKEGAKSEEPEQSQTKLKDKEAELSETKKEEKIPHPPQT